MIAVNKCFLSFSHFRHVGASWGGGDWWGMRKFRGIAALGRVRAQAARFPFFYALELLHDLKNRIG